MREDFTMRLSAVGLMLALALGFLVASLVAETPRQAMPVIGYRHSTVKQNVGGTLRDVFVRITNSSLASQAVGPPGSNFEMSWENRTFPDIGKKMVSLKPLAKQRVHPQDSVLGGLSAAGKVAGTPGLTIATYADMIHDAFQEQWWNNTTEIISPAPATVAKMEPSTNNPRAIIFSPGRGESRRAPAAAAPGLAADQYIQIQWNFSLFFGLAVQAYEATLVSDDTPFDRFQGAPSKGIQGNPNALTPSERNGLSIFVNADSNLGGRCNNCHAAPVMTNHSIADIKPDAQGRPNDIVEFMI